jgi:hypothetical protein
MTRPEISEVPPWAAADPRKRELYGRETYFREAWRDIEEVFGAESRRFALGHTLVLLKPETLVTRQWPNVLAHLAGHGFTVRHAEEVRLGRHVMRTLWAFQINKATFDRVDLLDILFGRHPSVLLVVAGRGSARGASERLSALKGPPDIERRGPEHLRSHLAPMSRLFTYVHVCSETADLVREFGILYDRPRRRDLLTALRRDATPVDAGALCERLAIDLPAHDLELDTAWGRILEACARPGPTAGADRARQALARHGRDGGLGWERVRDLLALADLGEATWDRLVLGSHLAVHDRGGVERTLP